MKVTQCWSSLAAAVIHTGVNDREKAVKRLSRNPNLPDAKETVKETDEFFGSQWFEDLLEMSDIGIEAERFRENIYGC